MPTTHARDGQSRRDRRAFTWWSQAFTAILVLGSTFSWIVAPPTTGTAQWALVAFGLCMGSRIAYDALDAFRRRNAPADCTADNHVG